MTLARRVLAAAAFVVAAIAATGCAATGPSGGWLGMHGRTIEDGGETLGVEVLCLDDDSPLHAAGVRKGDLVVSLDGDGPLTADDLVARVRAAGWERPVRLGIDSDGDERTIDVVPGPGKRVMRISFFLPLVISWQPDDGRLAFFPLTPLSVGIGPDHDGARVLGCVGWEGSPDRADLYLGVVSFGTGYREANRTEVEAGARTEVGAVPR
jgi:hypothetical protein